MGSGGGAGGGAASGESALAQGTALGGGWVRHGMDLEGLETLWEIVLNATGEKGCRTRFHRSVHIIRGEAKRRSCFGASKGPFFSVFSDTRREERMVVGEVGGKRIGGGGGGRGRIA